MYYDEANIGYCVDDLHCIIANALCNQTTSYCILAPSVIGIQHMRDIAYARQMSLYLVWSFLQTQASVNRLMSKRDCPIGWWLPKLINYLEIYINFGKSFKV
jgi:hypothetical protein